MLPKMSIDFNRYSTAFIDLSAFRNNLNIIRKMYPEALIILPVKANAYGHGDVIIAKEAEKIGIEYLGVARVEEGVKLRENGITLPIIDLGVESGDNIDVAIENNIELSVHSKDSICEILDHIKKYEKIFNVHLKIDTGMRRLGCEISEAREIAPLISKSKSLHLKSVFTHYANSGVDKKLTDHQTELFESVLSEFNDSGLTFDFFHSFNSGAIISTPKMKGKVVKAIRPGIMTYGYSPNGDKIFDLKPVMTLKSRVIHIKKVPANTGVSYGHTYTTDRESFLATIPLGYGDGFLRNLSNKFKVTINGKHYMQVGTISMDLMVIKVDESVRVGDEVIVFGNKELCANDAKDLAGFAGTISYEITTLLNSRIRRVAFYS